METTAPWIPPNSPTYANIALSSRRTALEHLQTAYWLLLGNHGEATALFHRQRADTGHARFRANYLREYDYEDSGQIAHAFLEAQHFLAMAMTLLGRSLPEIKELGIFRKEEAIFDGFYDRQELEKARRNVAENQKLGLFVAHLFESVRTSDPSLHNEFSALQTWGSTTDGLGWPRYLAWLQPWLGAPTFWTTDRWIAMGVFAVAVPAYFFLLFCML